MKSTTDQTPDEFLTRPLLGTPIPKSTATPTPAPAPRRITDTVLELDGKWFTNVPLPTARTA